MAAVRAGPDRLSRAGQEGRVAASTRCRPRFDPALAPLRRASFRDRRCAPSPRTATRPPPKFRDAISSALVAVNPDDSRPIIRARTCASCSRRDDRQHELTSASPTAHLATSRSRFHTQCHRHRVVRGSRSFNRSRTPGKSTGDVSPQPHEGPNPNDPRRPGPNPATKKTGTGPTPSYFARTRTGPKPIARHWTTGAPRPPVGRTSPRLLR